MTAISADCDWAIFSAKFRTTGLVAFAAAYCIIGAPP